ncbi:MAG: transposase domain-containing protein [Pseudomonadota bacterium]
MDEDGPKMWWSASEIAAAQLPGLPTSKRRVADMAKRAQWLNDKARCRKRKGRGGGLEYHRELFPVDARRALEQLDKEAPAEPTPTSDWVTFDALPDAVRAKAHKRLSVIQEVEALGQNIAITAAVARVADAHNVSARTIFSWLEVVRHVPIEDRLPALAPRHRTTPRNKRLAEVDPEFMARLKSDYLRFERPSFSTCYRRAVRVAQNAGYSVPTEATARRRLNNDVSKPSQIYARYGLERLKQMFPHQTRDKRALGPMEAVNADFHKLDVFVHYPGQELPVRPQMVAFQDVYSGRLLSWRLDLTPNKTAVALAFGDMIERFGIPQHVLLDNGVEFSNKYLTGQARSRNRYTVKEDDIQGLFVALGCEIHWATPYSGQSKPIERAFRDLCDNVAKDPRFAGAYTGNRPDAKPENYGDRAMPLERFLAVLAEGIEEHNARVGRRSDTCHGRSFIETFDTAYATAPIRRANAVQKRLCMMGAEGLKCHSNNGAITFLKNRYWADWMHTLRGQRVTVRFDPADLWAGIHIYALDGRYLGEAECQMRAGFFDLDEAKLISKTRQSWMAKEKAAAKAHKKYTAAQLGEGLDAAAAPAAKPPEAKVYALPKTSRKHRPTPQPTKQDDAAHAKWLDEQGATRLDAHRPKPKDEDANLARYRDALEVRARIDGGEAVSTQKRHWLEQYERSPEFKSLKSMHETHGEAFIR